MSGTIIILGVVHVPHWPSEGSHKMYGAAVMPEVWLPCIHRRKEDYLEKLESLFCGVGQSWFSTLDRDKRHAALLQEERHGHLVSSIIPILGIQGSSNRYAGFTYIDDAEA